MNEAIHYPLYVTPPEEIDVTYEQFDKMSYLGIASFFCSWPFVIHEKEDGTLRVFMSNRWFWTIRNHPITEDKKMSYYESAEFGYADVRPGEKFYVSVQKLKHLFFRK